jgi:hypothetical protein
MFVNEENPMRNILLLSLICLWLPFNAAAIDPGSAKGNLVLNGTSIPLTHAYAEVHDNAEGALDYPKELRILVADREVPQQSLNGLMFLPIETMARNGQVRGLLIRMNPADASEISIRLLAAPTEPGEMMMTLSRSGDTFKDKDFKFSDTRVAGAIEEAEKEVGLGSVKSLGYNVSFSAPVFNEPAITADLKGAAAQKSPQIEVFKAKIEAMAKGDVAALKALSTARANDAGAAFLSDPRAADYLKQGAEEMRKSLAGLERIIERGDVAVAVFAGKSYMSFAKENGVWKADN